MQWKMEFEFQSGQFPAVKFFFAAQKTDDGAGVGALRSEMGRSMFRDSVRRAELPALTTYRAIRRSKDEMSAPVARARVELERIQAHDILARADLTGQGLALRLVELEDQRVALEDEIRTLERGNALYASTVNDARQRAQAELEPLVDGTAKAVAWVAQQRCEELQKRIHDFVSPLLLELEALQEVSKSSSTPFLVRQLSASISGIVDGHGEWSDVDGRGERMTQAAAADAASPEAGDMENAPPPPATAPSYPAIAPIPEMADVAQTTRRHRLEL